MERVRYHCQLSGDVDAVEIAKNFLWAEGFGALGTCLKFYRNEFYEYVGTHYKVVSHDSLLIEILSFLQNQIITLLTDAYLK